MFLKPKTYFKLLCVVVFILFLVFSMMTLDKIDVKGKRVLVRADLNSPLENGKILVNPRIHAHAKTIKTLSDRGAKVIVISHQGRKGDHDFINLEQHAKMLKELAGKHVEFIDHIIGKKVIDAILHLKEGEIIVLDNVRHLDDEMQGDGKIVHEISPHIDYFVLDALSVAHREHASVVGFTKTVPSCAGTVLAEEIAALEKVKESNHVTFFFGGSKVDDSILVMKKWLEDGRAEKILLGGALSILFLYAQGYRIGKSLAYLEKKGILKFESDAKEMLYRFSDKIVLPIDVGLHENGIRIDCTVDKINDGEIFDIGPQTMEIYESILKESSLIVANGPAGVYEIELFAMGTMRVLKAISESKGFSLLGGGHTITALERSGIHKKSFGYISLSGKALIEFLCGKKLPGLVALEENKKKFFK